jgi:hypothetical protein
MKETNMQKYKKRDYAVFLRKSGLSSRCGAEKG